MEISEIASSYLSDTVGFTRFMAKLSLVATFVFVAFGWVSQQTGTITIGMFFLICFFGFLYANRKLVARQSEKTFHGIDVDQHIPKPKV